MSQLRLFEDQTEIKCGSCNKWVAVDDCDSDGACPDQLVL